MPLESLRIRTSLSAKLLLSISQRNAKSGFHAVNMTSRLPQLNSLTSSILRLTKPLSMDLDCWNKTTLMLKQCSLSRLVTLRDRTVQQEVTNLEWRSRDLIFLGPKTRWWMRSKRKHSISCPKRIEKPSLTRRLLTKRQSLIKSISLPKSSTMKMEPILSNIRLLSSASVRSLSISMKTENNRPSAAQSSTQALSPRETQKLQMSSTVLLWLLTSTTSFRKFLNSLRPPRRTLIQGTKP